MRAITYSTFGAAADVLQLIDMPTPDPGPGEVLVELAYSGVNPSDVKARNGSRPGVTAPPFPEIIPHSDGSGVIVAVGDGVDAARLGQRVWIWNGQWQRPFGTCATHIALPSDQAVTLPEGVDLKTGATLGIPGLTAAQAVLGGGAIDRSTLLVHGGAGSVGYLAVQIARWAGAQVIATARPEDHDRVRTAGADVVLDYRADDLAQRVLEVTGGKMIDRIVDVEFGLNIETDAQVIAPNGTIVAYGSALEMTPRVPFGPLLFKAATIDILLVYILQRGPRTARIADLHAALGAGALQSPIDAIFPLAQTALAHDAVAAGRRAGATLVDVTA